MPVFPLVASTIVVRPGSMIPSRSAASIIATPIRSLTLPAGLYASSLAYSSARTALRELCRVPKLSTYAIGALLNEAVARMPESHTFVNVGVWHGFTFLAGLVGNPDRRCHGIDDFSQFGGPRDEFLERFERLR